MGENINNTKIKRFKDLNTWKESHKLVLEIYRITKDFPSEEKYSLVDQMKRCSVSITSHIAEGFSRQGDKEKLQFYFTTKGSLTELENQLIIANDIGYIKKQTFDKLIAQIEISGKLLTGL